MTELAKKNRQLEALSRSLEQKNEELQKLDRLKTEFVSTVSHEMRTPLAITKEGIALVVDGTQGPVTQGQKDVLGIAQQNIDRLTGIISDLLDVSKLESGKIELRAEWVDLPALIRQVISSFEKRAGEKGLKLKVKIPDEGAKVYADGGKLIQILTNLIANAVKFTEKGFIQVSVEEKEGKIFCEVSDTGRGIAGADLHKAFEKFQQFGRKPKGGEQGTGLGLSIVKGLVELHRGEIQVTSRLKRGTRFTFWLPKPTPEEIFRERVQAGIRDAVRLGTSLSVIVFPSRDEREVQEKFGSSKTASLAKGFEQVIQKNLRREGDFVTEAPSAVLVVLPGTKKADAALIARRIRKGLADHISEEGLGEAVTTRHRIISFPADTKTEEAFLERIFS